MKIQYASDLHLEFPQNRNFLKTNPLQAEGDILLLAGDIVPFAILHEHDDFFDYVSDHFKSTYWIPGNHEYYYYDLTKKQGVINESIRSNVHLVNNLSVQLEGVRLILSTLWSKISFNNSWQCENNMSDFQVIKYGDKRFSVDDFNLLHEESLSFILSELSKETEEKTIVVSHHAPTFMNYPEKYKGSFLNEAFATELFDLIEENEPDYWIYGHHHCNTPDYVLAKTNMLTNQLGYVKYNEHELFNTKKLIII